MLGDKRRAYCPPDPDRIDWDNPIVIDFETYYDREYTLSKITTEEYVRSPLFQTIGVSVKVGARPAVFYKREDGIEIIRRLIEVKLPNAPVVYQNAMFDQAIMAMRYGINPKFTADTVVMARLSGLDRIAGGASLAKLSAFMMRMGMVAEVKGDTVHNMTGIRAERMDANQWVSYGDYCKLDTELTYALYRYMLPMIPKDEMLLSHITTEMFTKPVFELDAPILSDYIKRLEVHKDKALFVLAENLGMTSDELLKTLRSSAKFSVLCGGLGISLPMKWSEKKGAEIPAVSKTDKDFVSMLEHEDALVAELVAAKLGMTGNGEMTRAVRFLGISGRGALPIPLKYAGAHTMRYAAGDGINVQNLSKRTKEPVLRRSMRAPDGCVILASDASQVEARVNALISDQKDLTELFIADRDPYVDMAAAIYSKTYDEVFHAAKVEPTKEGKEMRNLGKVCVLSLGYGMSANTFRGRMELARNHDAAGMAETIVATYRRKNYMIAAFWKTCERALRVMVSGGELTFGGADGKLFTAYGNQEIHGEVLPNILLPNGTRLFYKNLRAVMGEDGRQGFAYDAIKGRNVVETKVYGALIAENLCQSLSFALLKYQALLIARAGVPINLNVHDEWVSIVPREAAAYAAGVHYKAMRSCPPYIPDGLIDCEVSVGRNYADLYPIDRKFLADIQNGSK